MKTGALVHYHEEIINIRLGLMMNNGMKKVSSQTRLLRLAGLEVLAEKQFLQMELTWESLQTY